MPSALPQTVTRDFTVAVFVVLDAQVLLLYHEKLARWLPPGGHIEDNELPDEAAIREVREETCIEIELHCEPDHYANELNDPVLLCRPMGIQLEDISTGHQHIDLIYFASANGQAPCGGAGWFGEPDWDGLGLSGEVRAWCSAAVAAVSRQR